MSFISFANVIGNSNRGGGGTQVDNLTWDDGDILLWDDGDTLVWGGLDVWIMLLGVWNGSGVWRGDGLWNSI